MAVAGVTTAMAAAGAGNETNRITLATPGMISSRSSMYRPACVGLEFPPNRLDCRG
ncbi:MAG: hypothetical protein ACI88G_002058 [Woeseiaceae bacterium]|jgi:hypothetical protein